MKHLSDEVIQCYLDNSIPEKMNDIKKHLDTCSSCRENLAVYENIYAELENEAEFQLSPNFAGRVADKVLTTPKFAYKTNFFNILLITASMLFMIIFAAKYIDFETIGQTTVNSMIPSLNIQPDQMMKIESQSVNSILRFKFLFLGVGILGIFFLIDKIMLNRKFVKSKFVLCI